MATRLNAPEDRSPRVWTPVDLIRWTAGYLTEKGFPEARLTAELLLAGTLGIRRLDLYLQFDRPLTADELAEFKARLKRRLNHEPLQYIEGVAHFRELELRVDRRVLIPRPETELLVGEVLAWAKGHPGAAALDIGTGSGAIALSLAKEGEFGRIVATDVSPSALEVARENARITGTADRVDFRQGRVFEPVGGERFDIIVSNPPYIGESERAELPRDVVDWEPASALFAGDDGLAIIRELVRSAVAFLNPGGLLALEIGSAQAASVVEMIRSDGGWNQPRVCEDLAGRDRLVLVEKTGPPD